MSIRVVRLVVIAAGSVRRPATDRYRCAGPPPVDARLRPIPEDRAAGCRRGEVGRRDAGLERRRQELRVRLRRQALSLRHRGAAGDGDRRCGRPCRARRPGRTRTGRAGARPSVRLRRFAGRNVAGPVQRQGSQSLCSRPRHQGRDRHHHRRQRREAHQVRHGQLGLRRRARSDHRHVVVARQPQAGVLSLRRERGSRLLPAARSDQAAELRRHRGLPEGRRAESDRRSADLRRRHKEDDEGRRARRQAVHQRRRRPLRLSRELESRRQGAAVQPHQPPPEHPRDGRRRTGERGSAGRASRRVADRLDREQPDDRIPQGQPALHLAVRAERLEQFLSLRSQRQADHPADRATPRSRRRRSSRSTRRPA